MIPVFFLFFLSFLFFRAVQATVSVVPSNKTDLPVSSASSYFRLWGTKYFTGQHLAPLTQGLLSLTDAQAKAIYISGDLTEVTNSNSLGLDSSQIACIPCDSSYYPGRLGVDWTVESVVTALRKPAAIVLYSLSASHCTISTDAPTEAYRNIFTVTDHGTATALQLALNSANRSAHISEMSSLSSSNLADGPGGGIGSSPNTAMIILYSITGIITALFLGIIITGAVRAHRHPERYGPRRIAGRPRQSRARGIARALLDTIPIVKFGDENADGVEAAKRDLEMANTDDPAREHPASGSEENVTAVGQTTPRETETDLPIAEDHRNVAPEPNPHHAPDGGNFSCPICTDDFVKGQDLRVLPCNHQFHPECIDPWLVNVSGTCPLCRIDLNPPKEEDAEQEGENGENGENNEETPTNAADTTTSRHSRRLTNYLNARRMHNASVEERLAALRQVREANQGGADESTGTRSSRNRLGRRLRERFRIRTRAHGTEGVTPVESDAATPTTSAAPTSNPNV